MCQLGFYPGSFAPEVLRRRVGQEAAPGVHKWGFAVGSEVGGQGAHAYPGTGRLLSRRCAAVGGAAQARPGQAARQPGSAAQQAIHLASSACPQGGCCCCCCCCRPHPAVFQGHSWLGAAGPAGPARLEGVRSEAGAGGSAILSSWLVVSCRLGAVPLCVAGCCVSGGSGVLQPPTTNQYRHASHSLFPTQL